MKYLFDIDGIAYEIELSNGETKLLEYKKGRFAKVSLHQISQQPTETSIGSAFLRVEFPEFGTIWRSKEAVIPRLPSEQEKQRVRIGLRIAELRKQQHLTQKELGERCGLQDSHIARIEKGRYSVGLDTLQRIADALGRKIDFVEK